MGAKRFQPFIAERRSRSARRVPGSGPRLYAFLSSGRRRLDRKVHARRTVSRGISSGAQARSARRHANRRGARRLDRLRGAAAERSVSSGSLALAWLIAHPDCTAPIVGPSGATPHLNHLAEALDLVLAAEERARIATWFEAAGRVPATVSAKTGRDTRRPQSAERGQSGPSSCARYGDTASGLTSSRQPPIRGLMDRYAEVTEYFTFTAPILRYR
ncbi:MAG: aldo/keto reductase [Betaproteobacteria bacterium]|nr:aldo/keto reductase [Betaproteobacteria bacterium]